MNARARALVAALFLSAAAARFGADSPAKPSVEADRIKALPDEERQWLTEFVASIILPEEKKAFLELTESYQREVFKLDFWARREMPDLPEPLGPGYRDRYEELWRLAEDRYGGWRQDTGRVLLRLGEPAEIFKPRCGDEQVFYGLEVWTYNNLGYSGRRTERYIFYRRFSNGPYKLYTGVERAAEVFIQNSCRRSFGSLSLDCKMGNARCGPCEHRCMVYLAYRESQQRTMSDLIELSRLFEPIPISTEGLERQKNRWATISNPKAKIIHVEGPSSGIGAPTPSPTPAPSPLPGPPRRLSADEIRDRIRQLEPKYREWLDLAKPLLSEEELSLFLQVPPKEKDEFIRKFWKSRS